MFFADRLRSIGLDPHSLDQSRPPRLPAFAPSNGTRTDGESGGKDEGKTVPDQTPTNTMTEEQWELYDAQSHIHDMLKRKTTWWISELLPTRQRIQSDDGAWHKMIVGCVHFPPFSFVCEGFD
jgi:hypothetical protein